MLLFLTMLGKFIYDTDLRFSWDNDDFDEIKTEITKYEVFDEEYIPTFNIDSTNRCFYHRVCIPQLRCSDVNKWSSEQA